MSSERKQWMGRVNSQELLIHELAAMGFETATPMKKCQSLQEMLAYVSELTRHRADLGYDIDGAVYKVSCVWLVLWLAAECLRN